MKGLFTKDESDDEKSEPQSFTFQDSHKGQKFGVAPRDVKYSGPSVLLNLDGKPDKLKMVSLGFVGGGSPVDSSKYVYPHHIENGDVVGSEVEKLLGLLGPTPTAMHPTPLEDVETKAQSPMWSVADRATFLSHLMRHHSDIAVSPSSEQMQNDVAATN